MSWNQDGGGPWGQGGGSQGPRGPRRGSNGSIFDGLDDFLNKLKSKLPGGGASLVMMIAIVVIVIWGLTGFYTVDAKEEGVVLRFGEPLPQTTKAGLNYHLPYPIERVEKVDITTVKKIDVMVSSTGGAQEHLMYSGDKNLVSVPFAVFWRASDPRDYLFNVKGPEDTIKAVAESVMRDVVASREVLDVLVRAKDEIARGTAPGKMRGVLPRMQKILDDYKMGVRITNVTLGQVEPPKDVIKFFHQVTQAETDREKRKNEALAYKNKIEPEAVGNAEKMKTDAQAYREAAFRVARGESARFQELLSEYKKQPEIFKRRVYLEVMQRVLSGTNKMIIDDVGGKGGVLPYLPLNELVPKKSASAAPQENGGGSSYIANPQNVIINVQDKKTG